MDSLLAENLGGTMHHSESNRNETVILQMFHVAPKGTPLSAPHTEIQPDQTFLPASWHPTIILQ